MSTTRKFIDQCFAKAPKSGKTGKSSGQKRFAAKKEKRYLNDFKV